MPLEGSDLMGSRDEQDSEIDGCLERLSNPPAESVDYELILRDSVTLLTARDFAMRLPGWQVAAIAAVFSRIISTSHAQAGAIAASARFLTGARTS